jgi:predicted Zn-dependent peptidase
VQQKVVKEEYNQRYMNRPYGDMWLLLRSLCYQVSPYRWATIGADIRHVAEATLEDVQQFHEKFYRPDNAIVAIAAPLKHEEMVGMAERAFGTLLLPRKRVAESRCFAREREYPQEPLQITSRRLEVIREVPSDAVYMAWPMCDRYDSDFQACDLISDILGTGNSSRLYRGMVSEGRLVSEADACITGDVGQGLLMVSAKVREGESFEDVIDTIRKETRRLTEETVDPYELEKVANRYESTFVFSQYKASDRATGLCYYTWLGDTSLVNREPERYRQVTPEGVQRAARRLFREENENILIIRKK